MKSLFIFFTLIAISLTTKSQLDKGIWLVGGTGSFYSYTEDYSTPTFNQTAKYTSIDVAASVGYFIIDKLVVGLRPTFSSFKGKVTSSGGGTTNSYKIAAGPFLRYYFLNKDKPFNLLADASYQIGINKYLGALREKGKFNTFTFMAGPEIFFNSTAGMEILVGYTNRILSIEDSPGAFNNSKSGLQISIGFQIHLEKL